MSEFTGPRVPLLSAYDRACDLVGSILGWSVAITVIVGVPLGIAHLVRWLS